MRFTSGPDRAMRAAGKPWLLWVLLCLSSFAHAFDHSHGRWTELLTQHVRWNPAGTASSVDYAGFAAQRPQLDAYLQELAEVDEALFQTWTTAQRQAFLINAYNAHTVALILTRFPELESIKDLGGWFSSPWKQAVAQVLGELRSLDDIEHGLLRGAPDFAEPRIHFAVNCASIGCPALRDEAFVAERLLDQLEDQTRRFLADRSRNRISAEDPVLAEVSSIFKWYAEDFGDAAGVQRFLARYADALGASASQRAALQQASAKLQFLDYDWALNYVR